MTIEEIEIEEIKLQVLNRDGFPIGEETWYMATGWTHIIYAEPLSDDGSHWVHSGTFPDHPLNKNIRRYIPECEKGIRSSAQGE